MTSNKMTNNAWEVFSSSIRQITLTVRSSIKMTKNKVYVIEKDNFVIIYVIFKKYTLKAEHTVEIYACHF